MAEPFRLNIGWYGGGGFAHADWRFVREVVRGLNVQTVLEYGCGLSTELMVVMGLNVTSLETQKPFAEAYKAAGFDVHLCDYDEGYPCMLGLWDLAFVDGPGESERHDRQKSVEHAMSRARLMYLHDYNLNQFEQLDASPDWGAATVYTPRQSHLYYHRGHCTHEKLALLNFVLAELLKAPVHEDLLKDIGREAG